MSVAILQPVMQMPSAVILLVHLFALAILVSLEMVSAIVLVSNRLMFSVRLSFFTYHKSFIFHFSLLAVLFPIDLHLITVTDF